MRLRLRLLALAFILSLVYAQEFKAQSFVNDIDGNSYPTVVIGTQEWMGENLRVSRYSNGDPILTDQTHDQWRFSTEGIWTNYDNNPANDPLYGKLYNWFATVDPRGLCPAGWRLPTDNDWVILTEFIDSDAWGNFNSLGANLKSRRQVNSPFGGEFNTDVHPRWDSHPKIYGVDAYGFGALPGGYYTMGKAFVHLGQYAYFRSSTETKSDQVWVRSLKNSNTGMSRGQYLKNLGISVRCVKGEIQNIQVPELITLQPTSITISSAVCGGEVLQDGGSPVTGRGLVWGTSPNPTIDNNLGHKASGTGLGVFTETIYGLDPGSTYWVRAYATNEAGTAYGTQKRIETLGDHTATNTIIVNDATAEAGTQITIEVEMVNQGDITAFQMDFELPDGFSYVEGSYTLSDRSQGHTPGQSILTNGKLRVLAYSATNNIFLGNSGILFTFKLNTPTQAGIWELNATNINLTNTSFENVFDGAEGGEMTLL